MSLAVLANHMASKGRHGDDMLVHMSRDEVVQLQKLAKAHGLTLTINPETGLPEAFSLKSLIKSLAPIALGAFLGPAGFGLTGFQSALAVGGIGALATGSLEKGLMMGLGAYGGAGLGEGLKAAALENVAAPSSTAIVPPEATAGAGTGAGAGAAPKFGYEMTQMTPRPTPFDLGTGMFEANAPTAAPEFFTKPAPVTPALQAPQPTTSLDFATANAKEAAWKNASLADKASMAYEGVAKAPGEFLKKNVGPGLAALYAGTALGQEQPSLPQGQRYQGYIRNYGFDPLTGTFIPGSIVPVSRYAADGGIMSVGYNGGGIVALAEGGVGYNGGGEAIQKLYSDIGRTGDAEGIAYWTDRLNSGESLSDITNAFGASAQYVKDREAAAAAPAASTASSTAATSGASNAVDTSGGIDTLASAQPSSGQLQTITNIYQNVLGRDPDAEGLNYWAGRLAQGESLPDVYNALQGSARYVLGKEADQLAPRLGSTLQEATTPYAGYKSADSASIGDEWVRNVLGREATAADRALPWYQSLGDLTTTGDTTAAYNKFLQTYGLQAGQAPSWFEAAQLKAPKIRAMTKGPTATTGDRPGWTFDPGATIGSGLIRPEEPAGKTTDWKPGSAGIPTMQDVVNAYTQGGGLTGRLPYVPKSLAEQEALYNRLTGSSKSAYDFLMGRGAYPTKAVTDGPISIPYGQLMGRPASAYNTPYIYDPATKSYVINPNYKVPELPIPGDKKPGPVSQVAEVAKEGGMADGGVAELAGYSPQEMASVGRPTEGYASAYGVRSKKKTGYTPSVFDYYGEGSPTSAATGPADPGAIDAAISMALSNVSNLGVTALGAIANAFSSPNPNPESVPVTDVNPAPVAPTDTTDAMSPATAAAAAATGNSAGDGDGDGNAHGGYIHGYAGGGIYNLGSYSDGGRLLKGPGDGVSDSIPATIGDKQPARLADGEFVIPARIVSELGNGSTDAGARKLYAMMDRIQAQRKKTVGKNSVAVNSRADKLLPA